MSRSIIVEIQRFEAVQRRMTQMHRDAESALQRILSDAKERVPGWVNQEILKVYGVDKGELTGGKLGSVRISGNTVHSLKFIYKGRRLTPVHFNMKEDAPTGGEYTVKATIIKGQRKKIGGVKKLSKKQRKNIGRNYTHQGTHNSPTSPNMLLSTKARHADAIQYIPFQRTQQVTRGQRDVWKKFTTVSLPQMATGERTAPRIQRAIDEKLGKRVTHHLKRVIR